MRKSQPGSVKADPEALYTLTDDEKKKLERFQNEISLALENYSSTYGIQDWKKCKPLEWRGFCLYVADHVFPDKSMLKEATITRDGQAITHYNAYSIPLLYYLYKLFSQLCYMVPGLPCRVYDFAGFVGIPYNTFKQFLERVSTTGSDFNAKIIDEQENSIAMAGEGGRINVTMALAWNNHFHGWTQAREVIHRTDNRLMDSGSWKSRFLTEKSNGDSIESEENLPVLPVNVEE